MSRPTHCPNGHQLYRSWAGTVGCEDEDCEHVRPQRPSEEIVRNYFHVPDLGCGHPHYVGWRRSGCRTEGCRNYLTGIDVTDARP